jgi:hypothetical protein
LWMWSSFSLICFKVTLVTVVLFDLAIINHNMKIKRFVRVH